jgi:DNA (cytosine-5)-methyltransferase 1
VFRSWCDSLRSLGYKVDHRVLCAADYGDPTTRRRLFVQAVRGRRKIVWPHPTHAPSAQPGLFARRKWVAARRIIDWKIPGKSIFERKKPLSEKTLRRIFAGLERFGLKPFLRCMEHGGSERSVERPMPTVTTARGGAIALAEPFLIELRGTDDRQVNGSARSIDRPAPTVTGGGRHLGLAEPFLVQVAHGNGDDANGDARRTRSVDGPLPTVCGTRGEWAVCEPFIVPNFGERDGQKPRVHSVDDPAPAVTGRGAGNLIEPKLLPQHGGGALRPVSSPAPTIACDGAVALVQPFLVHYYGNGGSDSVENPVATVTTRDRFGLVRPVVQVNGEKYELDILYRMLQPHELAGAQGFPLDYQFTGTKTEVVKQIGNAVPRRLARALVAAALKQAGPGSSRGLGKTPMQLVWAENVVRTRTGPC